MANGRWVVVLAVVGWLAAGLSAGILIGVLITRSDSQVNSTNAIPTAVIAQVVEPTSTVALPAESVSTATPVPLEPSATPTVPESAPSPTPMVAASEPSATPQAVGKSAAPPAFVGVVDNSDAFIGIAKSGKSMLVYVCDGNQGHETIAEWFKGDVSDSNNFDLVSEAGAHLAGNVAGDGIDGIVTLPNGTKLNFKASQVSGDGGLARVEESKGGKPRIRGWIFMPDGRFRGDGFPTYCQGDEASGNVYCPAAGTTDQFFTWCRSCYP